MMRLTACKAMFNARSSLTHTLNRQGCYHAISTGAIIMLGYLLTLVIPELRHSALVGLSILVAQIDSGIRIQSYNWRQLLNYYALALAVSIMVVSSCSYFTALATTAGMIWLCLISGSSIYVSLRQRQLLPCGVVLNILAIMAVLTPTPAPAAWSLWQLTASAAGLMLVVRLPLLYYQQRHKVIDYWQQLWQQLSGLYHLLFTLNADAQQWHLALMNSWAALDNCTTFAAYPKLLRLWQLTLRLAALRYRLRDTALLASKQELLTAINQVLQCVIAALANNTKASSTSLQLLHTKIAALENFYHHILAFATAAPEIIALFINDLKELTAQLATLRPPAPDTTIAATALTATKSQKPRHLLWRRTLRSTTVIGSTVLLGMYYYPLAILPITVLTMCLSLATQVTLPQMLRCVLGCMLLLVLRQLLWTPSSLYLGQALFLVAISILAYQAAIALQQAVFSTALTPLAMLSCGIVCLLSTSNYNINLLAIALGLAIASLGRLLIYPERIERSFRQNALTLLQQLAANDRQLGQVLAANAHHLSPQLKRIRVRLHDIWLHPESCFPRWVFGAGYNPALQPSQQYFAVRLWYLTEIQLGMLPLIKATAATLDPALKLLLRNCQHQTQQLLEQLSLPLQNLELPANSHQVELSHTITTLEAAIQQHYEPHLGLVAADAKLILLLRYFKDCCQQLQQLRATL